MQNSPDTIVSAGNLVEGKLEGTGTIQVLGTVRGEIQLQGTLLVDAGGLVDGTIEADHVLVVGSIQGRVLAREILEITATAALSGTYATHRLVVEQGARIDAAVSMDDKTPGLPTAQNKAASPTPKPAPSRSSFFDRPAETPAAAPAPTPAPAPRAPAPTPTPAPAAPAPSPAPEPVAIVTAPVNPEPVASTMESTSAILERAQAALANSTVASVADSPAEPPAKPEPPPIPDPEPAPAVQETAPSAPEPATPEASTEEAVVEQVDAVPVEAEDASPENAEKKSPHDGGERLSADNPPETTTSEENSGESMSLMFSEMLDEAEGDAHAGA